MNDIAQIKDRLDVVELLSEYLQLKQAGANWKGLCPFHNEKTPSFMVSREKQIWHCFGCGKGGDIFEFIQEIEGMEFVEALTVLAQRAGVTLQRDGSYSKEATDKRNRLREVLSLAAQFYHTVLRDSDAAQEARAYLERRGVNQNMIEQFQIGFIPEPKDSWTVLTDFLTKKKGYGVEECIAAGISKRNDRGRVYDTFRARVMFPLCDVHGSVVGFTGRLLQDQDGVGKYVNTPQTELFDKSQVLYGLHFAKQSAKQAGYFVLVEGQLDVIAAHQIGMSNVVAASGTALTDRHVQILKRYVPQIRVAFDNDSAGERAAKHGIDLALEVGLDVRVIQIPEDAGEDPDACIQRDPDVWKQVVQQAKPVFEYYIDRYVTPEVRSDPQQLRQVSDMLAQELARISDPVLVDFWAQKISIALGASIESVKQKAQLSAKKKQRYTTNTTPVKTPSTPPAKKTRGEKLGQYLLMILVKAPELIAQEQLDPMVFVSAKDQQLYRYLQAQYTSNQHHESDTTDRNVSEIKNHLAAIELLAQEKLFTFSQEQLLNEFTTARQELTKLWQQYQRDLLTQEIRAAEDRGDHERAEELIQAYQAIS